METRVTVISDTHGQHRHCDVRAGDLLIHCGDMFNLGDRTAGQVAAMDRWFGTLRHDRIVYTGGNHDTALEAALAGRAQPMASAHCLVGDGIEYRGLRIYGAPWVPALPSHAFHRKREALAEAWAKIPAGIDILVTHTPPQGILDASSRGRSYGCALLAAELQRIAPRVHCFGHVHASAGTRTIGKTLFVNAASIESGSGRVRPPVRFILAAAEAGR